MQAPVLLLVESPGYYSRFSAIYIVHIYKGLTRKCKKPICKIFADDAKVYGNANSHDAIQTDLVP